MVTVSLGMHPLLDGDAWAPWLLGVRVWGLGFRV